MCIGKLNAKTLTRVPTVARHCFASLIATLALIVPTAIAQTSTPQTVAIYTDTYRPYVNPVGEVDGSAMRLVRMTVMNMNMDHVFEHIDFGFGFHAVQNSNAGLSFPWLKTPEREEMVLFSTPIYWSKTELFYNTRFHLEGVDATQLGDKIYGRVVNYRYGEQIDDMLHAAETQDRVNTYPTDVAAIQALLRGDVDVLPQLGAVLNATLNASFPNQNRLVRKVPEISARFPNYVIAPKTPRGRAMISAFNESYDTLLQAGVINLSSLEVGGSDAVDSDIGTIVASEGFPVVIGVSRTQASESFAIPPGTKVLILQWSDRILAASDADQLYKTMVDETLVLVLNGPHIGKELLVKNMHLTIAP